MNLKKYGEYIDVENRINYNFGFNLNKYIGNISIGLGLAHASKNYRFIYRNQNSTVQEELTALNYFLIPLIINKSLLSESKNTFSLFMGIILIKPYGHSKQILNKNGSKSESVNFPVDYKFGQTFRAGGKYSKHLSQKSLFFLELFLNYKINLDYREAGSSLYYYNLTNDRFDLGINIGFEWLLKKNGLDYYKRQN